MKIKIVSSLEKCFLNSNIDFFTEIKEEKIFKNQKYSFQVVIDCETLIGPYRKLDTVPEIESEISNYITVRQVVNVPCEMPATHLYDEGCDKVTPGLFPDVLSPINYEGVIRLASNQKRAIFLTVDPKGEISGEFTVKIKFYGATTTAEKSLGASNEVMKEVSLKLTIVDALLPEQDKIIGHWFYADCIADYYKVEMFSDKHIEICENFIRTAVEGGRNLVLLPLLTYALDIYKGGCRRECQLIDVYKNGDNFTFNYDTLDKWLDMCNRAGVKYHEVSHFFSQWGADHTPTVFAYENGKKKKLFGWDSDPLSKEYTAFIRAFLKGFIEHMKERGEDKKCWFHISDEPQPQHLEQYTKVKATVADILEGYPMLDALSSYMYAEKGIVPYPVPKTSEIQPFLDNNVKNLMCYYTGAGWNGVSNSNLSTPLSRLRFLGIQMYKYNILGFLNWGYNFWNNRFSYDNINPYLSPDCEGFIPGGSAYLVYPAPNGEAYESLRFVAFYELTEDLRALKLCESLYSHQQTVDAIEEVCGKIVFDKCVYKTDEMMAIRKKINEMIFSKI